jgi:hypothetical protein
LQDKVIAGWNSFIGFMTDLWNDIVEFVTNMGRPFKLQQMASLWSSRVGGPMSDQVRAGDAGYLKVDNNWDGDAADAYRATLPIQTDALKAMQGTYADPIGAALNDVSTGILIFWGCLLAAVATLVGGIWAAITSAVTVFGLPAAPFIAALAVVTCAGSVLTGGLILKATASSANTRLQQKLSDGSALYRGHWPPAVTP